MNVPLNQELVNVKLDIEELQKLESTHAERESVKRLLQQEIKKLEARKSVLEKSLESKAPKSADVLSSLTQIANYAWEESDKFVKIYLDLGDNKQIQESDISLSFPSKKSVLLTFGKYKFSVKSLNKELNTESSYFKLTKSRIVVYLKKSKEGITWGSLEPDAGKKKEEETLAGGMKKEEEGEGGDDPSASLVKLMKKMYDEGDDDMKRTISKAWYESQSKQAGGLGAGLEDMNMPPL